MIQNFAADAPIAAVTFTAEEIVRELDQTVLLGVVVAVRCRRIEDSLLRRALRTSSPVGPP